VRVRAKESESESECERERETEKERERVSEKGTAHATRRGSIKALAFEIAEV
jgi:hypothetical protein